MNFNIKLREKGCTSYHVSLSSWRDTGGYAPEQRQKTSEVSLNTDADGGYCLLSSKAALSVCSSGVGPSKVRLSSAACGSLECENVTVIFLACVFTHLTCLTCGDASHSIVYREAGQSTQRAKMCTALKPQLI